MTVSKTKDGWLLQCDGFDTSTFKKCSSNHYFYVDKPAEAKFSASVRLGWNTKGLFSDYCGKH